MQQLARRRRLGAAVKRGWTRLLNAALPQTRRSPRRGEPHPRHFSLPASAAAEASRAIDPVLLTVLAVNRLGPATLRTAANGKASTVTVPDARTGEIFRAALDEMRKTRVTDRLVEIIVVGEVAGGDTAALH